MIRTNKEETDNINMKKFKQLIYIGSFLFLFSVLLIILFDNKEQNMNYFKNKYGFRKLPNFKINRDVSSSSVLLYNGNVLFSGGLINTHESTETTEIYNPIENKFHTNVNMIESRANHSSILLKNGDVLLTGGKKYSKDFSARELQSAEIFKVNENKFYRISDMNDSMSNHKMFLLENGNVLIVNNPYHIELFEYKTNTFKKVNFLPSESATKNKNTTFKCFDIILEKEKKLLLFFQNQTSSNNLILLINLLDLSIEELNSKIPLNYDYVPIKFNKDNVMIIGGNNKKIGPGSKTCEIYNFSSDILTSCSSLNVPRYAHTALNIDDGNILVLGGKTGFAKTLKQLKSTELYIPELEKFIIFKNMNYRRNNINSIKLKNGNYILYGSYNNLGEKKYTPELFVVNK